MNESTKLYDFSKYKLYKAKQHEIMLTL